MNRHFWQACDRRDRGAGFSLVELLVTIIIAAVAFGAMVPVFVQAAKIGQQRQGARRRPQHGATGGGELPADDLRTGRLGHMDAGRRDGVTALSPSPW